MRSAAASLSVLTALCASLFVSTGGTGANAASGLTAGYAFTEGAGTSTSDVSTNALTGALIGGAGWTTQGHSGNGLALDGSTSQYVDLGNPAALQLTGSATWSAWVRAAGNPADDGQIIAKSDNRSGWQLKTSPDTGPHTFGISITAPDFAWVQRFSTTVRQLDTWYHVAAVYDATARTLDIYVNGVLDNGVLQGTVPASILNSPVNANIGRRTNGYHFNGTIDDVRVYDRALTVDEIQADMNSPVDVVEADVKAPTAPGTPALTVVSGTQINLTWAAATDNAAVAGYRVERCQGAGCSNFVQIAAPAATSFSDTGLTAATSYSYRVRAIDNSNNLGPYSSTSSATTTAAADTDAPSAPGTPALTVVSSTQINLTWTAATDNVGVTGYRLERCQGVGCSSFTQIATPASASFSDTGLTASTSYTYRVRAVDAATNLGAYSATAAAATPAPPDTQAPSAPGTPALTVVSNTQINLTWTAATDNVGVTGYRLERCQGVGCSSFTQIATPASPSFSDTGLTASTSYTYRVRAVDAAPNLGAYSAAATAATPAPPDTQAPSAPGTPALTVVSSTQINLTWAAATDNVGVTLYVVERCVGAGCTSFAQIATPAGAAYNDAGLTSSTTYRYRVRAYDAASNASDYSTAAEATTQTIDSAPPSAPGNLAAAAVSNTQISLTWTAASDNVGVTSYLIERCQGTGCASFEQIATIGAVGYTDSGLAGATTYRYRVRATDAAANIGPYSSDATATTTTLTPGLEAGYGFAEGSGVVTSDASPNGIGGMLVGGAGWSTQGHYGSALALNGSTSQYVDLGNPAALQLTGSATWSAWVRAAGNPADDGQIIAKSDHQSGWQLKTSPDTGPHTFGIAITAPNFAWVQRFSTTVRQLNTWYHVAAVYDATARTLDIYVNGVLDNGLLQGTVPASILNSPVNVNIGRRTGGYHFNGLVDDVRVYDRALTASEIQADMNTPVGPVVPDGQAPTAPGTPALTVVSSTQINLTWAAATDNVGVTGYRLERCLGAGCSSFAQVATPAGNSFNDTGLAPSTSYSYRVRAVDAATNLGAYSATATAVTPAPPDTQAPTAPGTPALTAVSSTQINVTWAAATDNVGVTGYRLERCQGVGCSSFAQIAAPAGNSFNDIGLTGSTSYTYRVRAVDAATNLGAYSATATASTTAAPDTQAPTAPGTPALTVVSSTQINLTWAAATDNVGVTGYRLERCQGVGCSSFAQIAAPAGNSFNDIGLTGSTSYTYRVRAVDAATNLGAYSATATAVTPAPPDTQAPSAPGTPALTVVSATQISLTWAAATDNVGVALYVVERCVGAGCNSFAQIATPSSNSLNDTGLTSSTTYRYRVRAYDAASNASGYSAAAEATTQSLDGAPPSAPGNLVATAAGNSQVNLTWSAASDNVGVTGYLLERCQGASCVTFDQITTTTATAFSDSGLASATTYRYRVRATDAASNLGPYSADATATTTALTPGLVAGFGFSEGGGNVTTDVSPNGITGTLINGAGWTTQGRYGNGVTLNGSTHYVDLGNPAALQLTGSATWSAWVRAAANPADDGQIIAKSDNQSGWQLKTSPDTGPHTFGISITAPNFSWVQRFSTTVRQLNTWYHVAAVYNATARTLDIYVNGVLDNGMLQGTVPASILNSPVSVNIGQRTGGYHFNGIVDDVRIYARALTANEIQADMNTALGVVAPDTQAPTAPGTPSPTVVSTTQINLTWTPASDNVGVTGYLLERCQGVGCSTFAQIASPPSNSFNDTGLVPGTSYSYRVRAVDAAANAGGYSGPVSATTAANDTQAPTAPGTPAAAAINSNQIDLTWTASSDNVAVTGYRLERCLGANCTSFTQIAAPAALSYSDTGLSPATAYTYRVRGADAAGNVSAYSAEATFTTAPLAATAPTFVSEVHSSTDGCCGLEYNNATLNLNVHGTNRLLIAAWHAEWDGGQYPPPTARMPEAWTVTNNGVPGTPLVDTNGYEGGDGNRRFRIYYWVNPPNGNNTVRISNPNTGPNELASVAMLFENVDQMNPIGDVVVDVSMTERTSESETVSTTLGDLVLHAIANARDNIGGTLGAGETSRAVVNDTFFKGDASLWLTTKPGGNGTTTVGSSGWDGWVRIMNGAAIVLHGNSTSQR